MLDTNLKHLVTAKELEDTINDNENVMVCCGRMGPMCIPGLRCYGKSRKQVHECSVQRYGI